MVNVQNTTWNQNPKSCQDYFYVNFERSSCWHILFWKKFKQNSQKLKTHVCISSSWKLAFRPGWGKKRVNWTGAAKSDAHALMAYRVNRMQNGHISRVGNLSKNLFFFNSIQRANLLFVFTFYHVKMFFLHQSMKTIHLDSMKAIITQTDKRQLFMITEWDNDHPRIYFNTTTDNSCNNRKNQFLYSTVQFTSTNWVRSRVWGVENPLLVYTHIQRM